MATKPSRHSESPARNRRGAGLGAVRTRLASPGREPGPATRTGGPPVGLLRDLRLFQGVPAAALRRIAALMQPCAFAPGKAVFREGDAAHDIFVLAAGRLEVTVKAADPEGPPLNAIIGFSEVLLDPSLVVSDAERQQFLIDILNSGRHLLKLINEVLDLAKVEAGRMELHLAPADLAELIEQVRSTTRPLAARKSIDLSAECDPAIRPFLMDAARIRQVLLNLVGNALKFTPEGGRVWVTSGRMDDGRGAEGPRGRWGCPLAP